MPYLYQEYVGHDNNRDGYMLNMVESQSIFKVAQEYSPVIWYFASPDRADARAHLGAAIRGPDVFEHQPLRAHVDHVHRHEHDGGVRGAADARRHRAGPFRQLVSGLPGLHARLSQHHCVLHGERARIGDAQKLTIPSSSRKDMRDLKSQVFYPSPWKGGMWRLSDTIRYDTVASLSTLDTAVRYREVLLYNRYQAGRDVIRRFETEGLFAYVLPGGQPDAPQVALLAQKLIDQGLSVSETKSPVVIGGETYPAGSWVIPMTQPYAALVKELFETPKYPDAVMSGNGGKPVTLPYDVTGWTLPLQMGVKAIEVKEKLSPDVLATLQPVTKAVVKGGILGDGRVFALSRKVNGSFLVVNEAIAKGASVAIASRSRVDRERLRKPAPSS